MGTAVLFAVWGAWGYVRFMNATAGERYNGTALALTALAAAVVGWYVRLRDPYKLLVWTFGLLVVSFIPPLNFVFWGGLQEFLQEISQKK